MKTFIDFFCGGGGFSLGFYQQGFKPIRGIDSWEPAIKTHNLNFGLNDTKKNVLDFENIKEIENLEDSDIIIGSPPCVSFSLSNKAGNADKSLGIRLIETFLKVVAVKKHKKNSILKAWYMENVPNSKNFVKEFYTFKDLNLEDFAIENNLNINDIALYCKGKVLNSNDYGSPQKRERFICGEYIERLNNLLTECNNQSIACKKIISNEFLEPEKVDSKKVLKDILNYIPNSINNIRIKDPNYNLFIEDNELTDQYYDTGLSRLEWEKAKRDKENHLFGGIMSFPENLDKPSRTIMATKSGSTRESMILKGKGKGNGEYRLPTIREIASLMGFPLVFNFYGSESTKWRQIGNAVCPHMSFALAKEIKKKIDPFNIIEHDNINFEELIKNNKENKSFINLNGQQKVYKVINRKNIKFRRHFFKYNGIVISLSNYKFDNKVVDGSWYIYINVGTGKSYKSYLIDKDIYKKIELLETKYQKEFNLFNSLVKDLFKIGIPNDNLKQKLYDEDNRENCLDLETFFEKGKIILDNFDAKLSVEQDFFLERENLPLQQIFALHLISLYLNN